MGDGVQHHMMARFCWKHPELLLDQWGKPLFTLLASPFAQFGYAGMAAFNALVAGLSGWLLVRALPHAGGLLRAVAVVLLVAAPWYALLVVDGMTEVLFGGMALAAVVVLMERRWMLGALLAGLTPLCRPEYVVFLPTVALWLAVKRQWRSMPWLAGGVLLYTVAAMISGGGPLSWWRNDPYAQAGSAYGAGDPWAFIAEAPVMLGWPLVLLFAIAALLWWTLRGQDSAAREKDLLLLICAALPALAIIGVHAVLWWTGSRGSAGLGRVMVTATPLMVLFTAHTLARADLRWMPRSIASIILLSAAGFTVAGTVKEVPLVQQANTDQRMLHAAADRLATLLRPGARLFVSHTYVPFRLGLDTFDKDQVLVLRGFREGFEHPTRPGDLVFWESQLGPNECGTPLERLLGDTAYAVRGCFVPDEGHLIIGGVPMECLLFERRPVVRWSQADTLYRGTHAVEGFAVRQDTVACEHPESWCGAQEFPWTAEALAAPTDSTLYDIWAVDGEVVYPEAEGETARMVLTQVLDGRGIRYEQYDLKPGMNSIRFRVPPFAPQAEMKLYVWAPGGRRLEVRNMCVVRAQWRQRDAR